MRALLLLVLVVVLIGGGLKLAGVPLPFIDYAVGPMGDGAKLQCSTCHNGIYKPLYGRPMAPDYPGMYPAPPAPAGRRRARSPA